MSPTVSMTTVGVELFLSSMSVPPEVIGTFPYQAIQSLSSLVAVHGMPATFLYAALAVHANRRSQLKKYCSPCHSQRAWWQPEPAQLLQASSLEPPGSTMTMLGGALV